MLKGWLMNKVFGFGLGLILAAMGSAQTNDSSTSPTSSSWTDEERVKYICIDVLKVDCSTIIENKHYPQIVYTEDSGGAYGRYFGDPIPDVIFVDSRVDPVFAQAVILHELTHFLHFHLRGNADWPNYESCDTEKIAFQVSSRFFQDFGIGEDRTQDWFFSYGCKPE